MKRITFVTLFPDCPNYGLVKDVGQIPYHLSQREDIEASLVSAELDLEGPYVNNVNGLRLKRIPLLMGSYTFTGIVYLIRNSRKIDVLNLYHCRRNTYIYAKLFKFLNKNGKIYLKLDAGLTTVEKIEKEKKYRKLFTKLSETVDFMSAESRTVVEKLKYNSKTELLCIPNGTDMEKRDGSVSKQNIFLTVARIGAKEKNNDILLEAYARIADKTDWNLRLVGKIEDSFKDYIAVFFSKHSELKNRIVFTGEITDRSELQKEYARAKVFVLPSKYESFSLATVEALCGGCYIILSDKVAPFHEFTNEGKYGLVTGVNDIDDLADKLFAVTEMKFGSGLFDAISSYAEGMFSWKKICRELYTYIRVK